MMNKFPLTDDSLFAFRVSKPMRFETKEVGRLQFESSGRGLRTDCPAIDYKKLSSYSLTMGRRKPGMLLPLELRILTTVEEMGVEGSEAYGFSVATALSVQGGKKLTAHGTLYKALARMTEAGLLASHWENPEIAESQGRPRRRLYSITNNGRSALAGASRSTPAQTVGRPSFKPVQA